MIISQQSLNLKNLKYLVVGAGFFGSVIAERIAEDKKERVVVIEKRNHIGGNSFSEIDGETGVECHKYGSHIFHTSNEKVWKYINRFCTFNNYRHKVLTQYKGKVYQLPINLATINSLYGVNLTPPEAVKFIASEIEKEKIGIPLRFEEKGISLIGRPLYEAFIKGYTVKQWETDPKELPANIITRLPVRYNYNDEYFDDIYQGIPLDGYGSVFSAMLKHKNIEIHLNTDYLDIRHLIPNDCLVIYTGPLDRLFDYKFGLLGWRTLTFEKEVFKVDDFQGTSVMNYAELSVPYTRIHEFKHFHRERVYPLNNTLIFREYSKTATRKDDFYYPINTEENKKILNLYNEECQRNKNLILGGRLGTWTYLNMDQVIESALTVYEEKIKGRNC